MRRSGEASSGVARGKRERRLTFGPKPEAVHQGIENARRTPEACPKGVEVRETGGGVSEYLEAATAVRKRQRQGQSQNVKVGDFAVQLKCWFRQECKLAKVHRHFIFLEL